MFAVATMMENNKSPLVDNNISNLEHIFDLEIILRCEDDNEHFQDKEEVDGELHEAWDRVWREMQSHHRKLPEVKIQWQVSRFTGLKRYY